MSKITRQTYVQFGVNVNSAADICGFGTPATGSPVYTTTIATLQANSAWTTGWAAETISSNRPFLEDMNAVCYVFSYMLAYLFEMGIPEYDSGTTYYTNSIVQYGGVAYQSLVDANLNNTPTVGANWKLFTTSVSGVLGAWTAIVATTIYQAATDGFVVATLNSSGMGTNTAYIKSDSNSTPTTIRAEALATGEDQSTLTSPVRKGDYYTIVIVGTGVSVINTYFIALGS